MRNSAAGEPPPWRNGCYFVKKADARATELSVVLVMRPRLNAGIGLLLLDDRLA